MDAQVVLAQLRFFFLLDVTLGILDRRTGNRHSGERPTPRARVAAATRREEALAAALRGIQIGAVGPVVAEELRWRGFEVTITPDRGYFMKPLVSAFLAAFSR